MTSSEKLLVHVGLDDTLQRKLVDGGDDAVASCAKDFGLTNVNAERLRLFGILTGRIRKQSLEPLRQRQGVAFVETDKVQKAI